MNFNLDIKSELKPACCKFACCMLQIYSFNTKCPTFISCYTHLTPNHAHFQGVQVNVTKNLGCADDIFCSLVQEWIQEGDFFLTCRPLFVVGSGLIMKSNVSYWKSVLQLLSFNRHICKIELHKCAVYNL